MTKREREMSPTLCWRCKKAIGHCSWSDGSFQPVEGWIALQTRYVTELDGERKVMESYCVYGCPEFEHDEMRLEHDD